MPYKVKEVAELVGVSVRTIHHYHHIGLLKPTSFSTTGYRLYSDDDLERLQQILFFKELDFNLQEIKEIIDNPNFDRKEALKAHKRLLKEKKERLERIIISVDKTIKSIEGGKEMSKKDMFEAFDMKEIEKHKEKYADEAKQRWGHTDAYKESAKRTAQYTKEDWARIQAKGNEIYQKLADAMDKGPASHEAQAAIGEWRQHISDNFYNCNLEILRGLGEMYIADERFTKNIDKFKPGLAAFKREAILIYCNNQEEG